MIALLTAGEMRAADGETVALCGVDQLMRNAGACIAHYITMAHPAGRIVAFAGPGNNGGDVFAARSFLPERDWTIYAPDGRNGARPLPASLEDAVRALDGAALAIDGLLGTGARLPLAGDIACTAAALDRRRLPVLAIDIPTGLDADSGALDPAAVNAGVTLTLGALKPGLIFEPGYSHAGEVILADIGIPEDVLSKHARTYLALDDAAFLALLPRRDDDADKRSAGAPLIVAGSEQFPGAAVLCARAAARAGAGYVTVATPQNAAPLLRGHLIEQVVVAYDPGADPIATAEQLVDIARHNAAVAIGPGLGLDDWTGRMVRALIERLTLPFVVDASALFHLAKHLELLRGKACVITPHAGEFARLSGEGTIAPGTRVARLRSFVERTRVTTLLKGRATLISSGGMLHVNLSATKALATAGSGDTLTGIIATLLAQGCSPIDAARTGAYWHGLAGRYCEDARGIGVVAGDLADALGPAMLRSQAGRAAPPRRLSASSSR